MPSPPVSYSPLTKWDVHNESTSSKGTSGFAGAARRCSYVTDQLSQGGSGCLTPLPQWGTASGPSASYRSSTPRHSYIQAPVLHKQHDVRAPGDHVRNHQRGGSADEHAVRGAPLSNAPLATWTKEPGRRSAAFAATRTPQRQSYAIQGASSVTAYSALDDWGRSKCYGKPTAGMMSKSPRHSYIAK